MLIEHEKHSEGSAAVRGNFQCWRLWEKRRTFGHRWPTVRRSSIDVFRLFVTFQAARVAIKSEFGSKTRKSSELSSTRDGQWPAASGIFAFFDYELTYPICFRLGLFLHSDASVGYGSINDEE